MSNTYDDSRNKYYELVKKAETLLANMKLSRNAIIEKNQRLNLMIAISTALVYRAESYVSPSTVMHVVRVMQGKEVAEDCANLKINKSKAKCALGQFGYLMSCFEQVGYLYRFSKTYCVQQPGVSKVEQTKCDKKYNKYIERFNNGIEELAKNIKPTTAGGKKRRRKYSKKTRFYKKKQTRRFKSGLIKRLYKNI
jgi:hypothetical protein